MYSLFEKTPYNFWVSYVKLEKENEGTSSKQLRILNKRNKQYSPPKCATLLLTLTKYKLQIHRIKIVTLFILLI